MKISGAATLHAPADQVWTALNDPAVLVRTIPGCEQLEATGAGFLPAHRHRRGGGDQGHLHR